MSEEKQEQLEKLNKYVEDKASEEVEKRAAEVESNLIQKFATHTESRTSPWTDYEVGSGEAFREGLTSMYRAWEAGDNDPTNYHDDKEYVKRFLGQGSQGGGNLIPEVLANDIIPQLYKRLVLKEAGATTINMKNQKLPMGRASAKPTATYVGEGTQITDDGPEADQVILDAKKLTARADVTQDWVRSDPRGALAFVSNELLKAFAVKMDEQCLEGVGSATAPSSVYEQMSNFVDYSAASGTVSSVSDLQVNLDATEKFCLDNNVRPGDIKVILGDRDFLAFRRLRDSGELVFPGLRESNPTLVGKQVYRTNIIAEDNADGGNTDADGTTIYLGDFSSIMLGIMTNMELSFSEHERFSYDEIIVKLVGHHDCKLKRAGDIAGLRTDFSYNA